VPGHASELATAGIRPRIVFSRWVYWAEESREKKKRNRSSVLRATGLQFVTNSDDDWQQIHVTMSLESYGCRIVVRPNMSQDISMGRVWGPNRGCSLATELGTLYRSFGSRA